MMQSTTPARGQSKDRMRIAAPVPDNWCGAAGSGIRVKPMNATKKPMSGMATDNTPQTGFFVSMTYDVA